MINFPDNNRCFYTNFCELLNVTCCGEVNPHLYSEKPGWIPSLTVNPASQHRPLTQETGVRTVLLRMECVSVDTMTPSIQISRSPLRTPAFSAGPSATGCTTYWPFWPGDTCILSSVSEVWCKAAALCSEDKSPAVNKWRVYVEEILPRNSL